MVRVWARARVRVRVVLQKNSVSLGIRNFWFVLQGNLLLGSEIVALHALKRLF
jgi:hypothetical protein